MKEFTIKDLKVLIAMPNMGTWDSAFGIAMLHMVTYFMQKPVPGFGGNQQLRPFDIGGSTLSNMRWKAVKLALRENFTHVLFIDSDQSFPKDLVHRWVAHNVDVVAANVATKRIPSQPTARYKPKEGDPGYGTPVYTDDTTKGLERVWRVGTGVMMVRTGVFRKIVEPLFEVKWREEVSDYQGEDWSMAECFERAGFDIWVDHDVSKLVGHWGKMNYTHALVGETAMDDRELNFLRSNERESA